MSDTTRTLRIGTRGSRLAMWQAERVRDLLAQAAPDLEVEIVVVHTLGDRDQQTPLAQLGGVGVFTKEIEEALRRDRCDVAVHSLKDVPTELEAGFRLVAMLEREDPRDALVARAGLGLDALPPGSVVGTSSLRRRSQLKHLRPDLQLCDLRGNVQTRLRAVGVEVEEGRAPKRDDIAATFLAVAGLKRLGLDEHISEALDPARFLPAPAQGVIGIEIRDDDSLAAEALGALDHAETRIRATAERTFLRTLEGGCRVPIAALAERRGDDLVLQGAVGDLSGERFLRDQVQGADPVALGQALAARLLDAGARSILDQLREAQR